MNSPTLQIIGMISTGLAPLLLAGWAYLNRQGITLIFVDRWTMVETIRQQRYQIENLRAENLGLSRVVQTFESGNRATDWNRIEFEKLTNQMQAMRAKFDALVEFNKNSIAYCASLLKDLAHANLLPTEQPPAMPDILREEFE